MKILFLCGCLEPGKDGVGDYTRRLAGECIQQGHEASIIALNDKFASEMQLEASKSADTQSIETLRLSSKLSWKSRIQSAKNFTETQNPDWVSLQYVPYAFHPKGLPFGLAYRLKQLGLGRKWHIMFHELCVGLGNRPPFRHRILGYLQRRLIHSIQQTLDPNCVHAQSTPYVNLLQLMGLPALRLPLFSNIPIVAESSKKPKSSLKNTTVRFAFFGSVHPGWDVAKTAKTMMAPLQQLESKARIIAIGRGGPHASGTWNQFRALESGIEVEEKGSLESEEISIVLSSCHFGLSASCPDLIEKSGSAVALFDHGLPVLITRDPIWGERFLSQIRDTTPLAVFGNELNSYLDRYDAQTKHESIREVSAQFLKDLKVS